MKVRDRHTEPLVKKGICFFLLIIFAVPLLFQPKHILSHHPHSCVKVETVASHSVSFNNDNGEILNCPICNFQFSTNEESKTNSFYVLIPSFYIPSHETDFKIYLEQVELFKSSRAPPLYI